MKEYIEKEELLKKIKWASTPEECIMTVRKMITADVVPKRYGKWEWHEDEFEYECSSCGCRFDYTHTYELFDHGFEYANYCPNCGSQMIGDI